MSDHDLPRPGGLAETPYDKQREYEPCPSCLGGYQFIGGIAEGEIRCHDCFGYDVRGAGDLCIKCTYPQDPTRYLEEKRCGRARREEAKSDGT
jgi:hypothetical protein